MFSGSWGKVARSFRCSCTQFVSCRQYPWSPVNEDNKVIKKEECLQALVEARLSEKTCLIAFTAKSLQRKIYGVLILLLRVTPLESCGTADMMVDNWLSSDTPHNNLSL